MNRQERLNTIDEVVRAHGDVDEYYVIANRLYMVIEQGHDEYAIKCNDLQFDARDDGHWIKVNGISRYETLSGACRGLLIYLCDEVLS